MAMKNTESCFRKASIFPCHVPKNFVEEDLKANAPLSVMVSLSLSLTGMNFSEFFIFDDYYQTENISASDDEIVSNALNLAQRVETELERRATNIL